MIPSVRQSIERKAEVEDIQFMINTRKINHLPIDFIRDYLSYCQ